MDARSADTEACLHAIRVALQEWSRGANKPADIVIDALLMEVATTCWGCHVAFDSAEADRVMPLLTFKLRAFLEAVTDIPKTADAQAQT